MKINLLQLDDAFKCQQAFTKACLELQATEILGSEYSPYFRLWGSDAQFVPFIEHLKRNFTNSNRNQPVITFMGSGDFHHVSAFLIGILAEKHNEPITVIHFDNHPDWVHFDNGVHCGSWVNKALSLSQVDKVITLGVCSKDLNFPEFKGANLNAMKEGKIVLLPYTHRPTFAFHSYGKNVGYTQEKRKIVWNNISEMGVEEFSSLLKKQIKTKSIYITIDKDVLSRKEAETNWDQGEMSLSFMLSVLNKLFAENNIIGVDVTGDYSTPQYKGSFKTKVMKKLEIIMDQPLHRPDMEMAANINQNSNMALLECFKECLR